MSWTKKSVDGIIPNAVNKKMPNRKRRVNEDASLFVRKFLNSLQKIPSHYCRSTTSKQYLEPSFQSLSQLYRVYNQKCEAEEQHLTVSRQGLSDEFNRMNLGLFRPKKDECDLCTGYKVGSISEEKYTEHLLNKEEARDEKK